MSDRLRFQFYQLRTSKNKDTQGLKDTHFPTLNLDKPQELSKQEKTIISDLKKQFLNAEKTQALHPNFF